MKQPGEKMRAAMRTRAAAQESASHASKPFFDAHPVNAANFFTSAPTIQAKLTVGQPGDRFEREADAVADRVVQRMEAGRVSSATTPTVQTACAEEMLQAKGESSLAGVPASVEQNLQSSHAGHSLAPQLQAQMEQAFQADFSSVRVHTGGSAEQLNQELHARAFTHGNDIYFNAGEFQPDSRAGQHLLAHELTHVVQQSPQLSGVPSVQRDVPKPGSPADKLQTAKNELKKKFGLAEISEQNGAAWTENQLKKIAALLSKMSADEQKRLRGVTLTLTDTLPSKTLNGKTFTIAGTTYGTSLVELTPAGVSDTMLHEAGHLIHNTAIDNADMLFERTKPRDDLEAARNVVNQSAKRRYSVPANENQIMDHLKTAMNAAAALESSGDDDRTANRAALEEAETNLFMFTPDAASKDLGAHVDKVKAFVAAMLRWNDEREKAVGPLRRLDEFVGIVKKDKLARRSVIFTPYVEANWPHKPAEFFAEAYKVWTMNPAVVKGLSADLAKWFEKGRHLGPKLSVLRQEAPVIEELLYEAGETFLPAVTNVGDLIP